MNDLTKNLLLWVVVAVVLMVVFQSFSPKGASTAAMTGGTTYSDFLDQVDSGNVQRVDFGGDARGGVSEITYTLRNGDSKTINAPFDRDPPGRRGDDEEHECEQRQQDAERTHGEERHRISPSMDPGLPRYRNSSDGTEIPRSANRSTNRGRTPVGSARPRYRPSSVMPAA